MSSWKTRLKLEVYATQDYKYLRLRSGLNKTGLYSELVLITETRYIAHRYNV